MLTKIYKNVVPIDATGVRDKHRKRERVKEEDNNYHIRIASKQWSLCLLSEIIIWRFISLILLLTNY